MSENEDGEQGQQPEQTEDEIIAEEYETWKKNCPFMYKLVSETALTWPSLTFQWIPGVVSEEDGIRTQNALLGTYTTGNDTEYLQIGQVKYPTDGAISEDENAAVTQISIVKKYVHAGEVNRARTSTGSSTLVATASVSGDVFLYDTTQDPEGYEPVVLKHHTENGYGLAWNPTQNHLLGTSSDDSTAAIWDVTKKELVSVLRDHTEVVNDISWDRHGSVFATVSDDRSMLVYDYKDLSKPALSLPNAHTGAINSVAFSPFSTHLVATVSADQTVALWDTRNLSRRLHALVGHSDSVTSIQWNPQQSQDGILATAGVDRRVILWDIRRIGEEQSPDDAEDGSPELIFMHGGHTAAVTDISWNPDSAWLLGSCSDDNIGQIWRPSDSITHNEVTTVPEIELE